MSNSILRDKSKSLAKQIVILCKDLQKSKVPSALVNQILRSGTSIGANIYAAQYAQGKKNFISKLEITLKECNETDYWIELLHETNSITSEGYKKFDAEIINLRRMLVSSVTTLKNKK